MFAAEVTQSLDTKQFILTRKALEVSADVLAIVVDEKQQISPELKKKLTELVGSLKPGFLEQLGQLSEKPLFPANKEQEGHWQYEQTMLRALLKSNQKIKEWLGCDDGVIADMFFMILASDLGKAGSIAAGEDDPSTIVRRMYNQALFFESHSQWLKNCDPSTLPSELQPALDSIQKTPTVEGAPSDWEAIFTNGFFVPIPLELYVYVIKQVALETADSNDQLASQAEQLFTLTTAESEYLKSQGWDPATTRIRQFYTKGHIKFGNDFLMNDQYTTREQQLLAPLALSHHFSQGILPDSISAEAIIQQPLLMKICAFLEILDKTEATYHRFGDKSMVNAIRYSRNECAYQLGVNYADHPELVDLYIETLEFMTKKDENGENVFSGLD